jgi:hypothetical protein
MGEEYLSKLSLRAALTVESTYSSVLIVTAVLLVGLEPALADVNLTTNCEPDGVVASVHAKMSPEGFWSGQLEEIVKELEYQRSLPSETIEIERDFDDTLAEADRSIQELCVENPNLGFCSPPTRSERLQEMAQEAEHQEMAVLMEKLRLKRISMLKRCRRKILARKSR